MNTLFIRTAPPFDRRYLPPPPGKHLDTNLVKTIAHQLAAQHRHEQVVLYATRLQHRAAFAHFINTKAQDAFDRYLWNLIQEHLADSLAQTLERTTDEN